MPSAGQIKSDAAPTQAGYVNPDLVVYSSVLGSNIGTWSFNWLGLASGDTLVAANYVPEQDKDATTGDDIGNNLTKNFALQYKDAQDTSGVTISADTWMIDWTARLDSIDDRERKANQDIYGRQTFINDGFKVEHNGGYTLKAGWGYVAGIRINQAADADLGDPGALPKDVWLDVALEGGISGVVATVTPKFSNTTLTDYTDSAGRVHYLEKIAAINGAGVVTDQRTSVTVADGETLADLFLQKAGPADETTAGTAREATLAEVVAGTLSKIFVSPAKLKAWWDQVRIWDNIKNKPATATRWPTAAEVNRYAGELAIFSTPTLPSGFPGFVLDGSTIPNGVNEFPELAASGSRFITFSGNDIILLDVPDVIRGKGSSDRDVGEFQGDAMRSVTGVVDIAAEYFDQGATSGVFTKGGQYNRRNSGSGTGGSRITFDVSRVVPVAPEFRMKSTTALFAICHGKVAA